MRLTKILFLLLLSLQAIRIHADEGLSVTLVKAPAMLRAEEGKERDLGTWDDVFTCEDLDFIVLQKGENLFSLPLTSLSKVEKLVTLADLKNSKIVVGTKSSDRLWLFCQSTKTDPFALDALSGTLAQFPVPGLRGFGMKTPDIQSYVIVPHARAALLMIAGGSRITWPRPGNRPVYFWISLQTGEVVQFPVGWDLDYFSADQTVAVFEHPYRKDSQKQTYSAVDMKTGKVVAEIPDDNEYPWIPFNWTNTDIAKPFMAPRSTSRGVHSRLNGISLNGSVCPLDIRLDDPNLSSVKVAGDWGTLHVHGHGSPRKYLRALWFSALKKNSKPHHLGDNIPTYEVLENGRCVFGSGGYGAKGASVEAFVYAAKPKHAWNVLDGIVRPPPLDTEFVDKSYIEDKMTLKLIPGFGGPQHERLVLCLFSHFRGDMRALVLPAQGKRLDQTTWRRAVVLSSGGERYMTNLFPEGNVPDLIWLHNSGKVITANYVWQSSGATKKRKVRLSEITLQLQE